MSCIIFAYSYLISHVSKPKSEGELGNKDLRLVNLVLLGKWRWRLITRWEAVERYYWSEICKKVYVGSSRGEGDRFKRCLKLVEKDLLIGNKSA